jgi:tRNA A-37 threonylcarbamoyl transferase component Bud32/membrane protein YdbS with pleckstrin-like domain
LERELFEGEQVLAGTRAHFVELSGHGLAVAVAAGVAAAALILWNDRGFDDPILPSVVAIVMAVVLVRFVIRWIRWRSSFIAVTNRRLIESTGVFTKEVTSFPLADVTEVHVSRPLGGRLFGYGHLSVIGLSGTKHIDHVPEPHAIHRAIAAGLRSPKVRSAPPQTTPRPTRKLITPPAEGDVVNGRYLLARRIASGGMGTVYEGRDEFLRRRVAVKLIREDLAGDAASIERFQREARAVASLAHPNIAAIFDYGETGATPFIVMELVRGRNLAHFDGPVSQAVAVTRQILDALAHAHGAGIIHRDIKPANVIVDDNGVVKVTDFGIAKAADATKITLTGWALGSAPYASPEQINGEPVGPESDIYSCGIVLCELITGAPADGDPRAALARAGAPPSIADVVARATAKDPARRFRSARDMSAALADVAADPMVHEFSATNRLHRDITPTARLPQT